MPGCGGSIIVGQQYVFNLILPHGGLGGRKSYEDGKFYYYS